MCLSAILGVGSALIGAGSAKSAAKSQKQSAQNQLALEERVYDETVQRFDPFLQSGTAAQNALAYELGLGPRPMTGGQAQQVVEFQDGVQSTPAPQNRNSWMYPPTIDTPITRYRVGEQVFDERGAADAYAGANPTGGTEYQGFQATPGYDFRRQSGMDAIDGSAASRGGLFSGATLKAQQTFGDNLASQEYGNYINRLAGIAQGGQAAAGNAANAGANFASGAGQAYGAMGNAASAGAIGVGNALQGGLNTGLGIWQYQNQQQAGQNALNGTPLPQGNRFGGIY